MVSMKQMSEKKKLHIILTFPRPVPLRDGTYPLSAHSELAEDPRSLSSRMIVFELFSFPQEVKALYLYFSKLD